MALERPATSVFSWIFMGAVIAVISGGGCGSGRESDELTGRQSQELASDGGGDGAACRETTLRARRERRHRRRDHEGPDGDRQDATVLSPPMAFAVPGAIALSECDPHAGHLAELSFERTGSPHEVVCLYASLPQLPAREAKLVACSQGVRAGDVVTAREVELGMFFGDTALAEVTLKETGACVQDAGPAATFDGSSGGPDAALDVVDASPPCTPATCLPSGTCSTATCTPSGCVQTALPAGTACASGSACTTGGCDGAGLCIGAPIVLPTASCVSFACDPVLGVVSTPLPDGTACNDGDACTQTDLCRSGVCVGNNPLTCTTSSVCLVASCNPALGCTTTPAAAGTSCSQDLCAPASCDAAGACLPGAPPNCSSGNACVVDSCAPATGCAHAPIPNCNPTPVQGDAPFETRAALVGRLVTSAGAGITGASFRSTTSAPRARRAATSRRRRPRTAASGSASPAFPRPSPCARRRIAWSSSSTRHRRCAPTASRTRTLARAWISEASASWVATRASRTSVRQAAQPQTRKGASRS